MQTLIADQQKIRPDFFTSHVAVRMIFLAKVDMHFSASSWMIHLIRMPPLLPHGMFAQTMLLRGKWKQCRLTRTSTSLQMPLCSVHSIDQRFIFLRALSGVVVSSSRHTSVDLRNSSFSFVAYVRRLAFSPSPKHTSGIFSRSHLARDQQEIRREV